MKYPAEIRNYMRGTLTIKVRYEKPSMKCTVSYGLWAIDLPRYINGLWNGLRGVTDLGEAKRLYKIITMEVNDMLKEYYEKYNQGEEIVQGGMIATQFNFPPIPRNDTVTLGIRNDVHIMSGATPTELWASPSRGEVRVDRYAPSMEYLTDEEYEKRKENGTLNSGTVYCVLN